MSESTVDTEVQPDALDILREALEELTGGNDPRDRRYLVANRADRRRADRDAKAHRRMHARR